MRRLVFHALAFFSLLLLGATAIAWLRSYWREDNGWTAGLPSWSIESDLGCVTINYTDAGLYASKTFWTTSAITPTWTSVRQRGFWPRYHTGTDMGTIQSGGLPPVPWVVRRFKTVTLPYWFPALLFVVLPAWWLRHRRLPGHCPNCAYDLRAHNPGDKCPECGTLVNTDANAPHQL